MLRQGLSPRRYADGTVDMFVAQGGLHHLPSLEDLDRCLDSIVRCLKPGGRFAVVEPWDTPFLRFVLALAFFPASRHLVPRLDALATMIEEEHATYYAWLGQPDAIRSRLRDRFEFERESTGRGQWMAVLRKPSR